MRGDSSNWSTDGKFSLTLLLNEEVICFQRLFFFLARLVKYNITSKHYLTAKKGGLNDEDS